jgi:hypothetical protein
MIPGERLSVIHGDFNNFPCCTGYFGMEGALSRAGKWVFPAVSGRIARGTIWMVEAMLEDRETRPRGEARRVGSF